MGGGKININNAGKNRRQQERGRPHMSWVDSLREAISRSLWEPSTAVEDRTGHAPLTHRVSGVTADWTAH